MIQKIFLSGILLCLFSTLLLYSQDNKPYIEPALQSIYRGRFPDKKDLKSTLFHKKRLKKNLARHSKQIGKMYGINPKRDDPEIYLKPVKDILYINQN